MSDKGFAIIAQCAAEELKRALLEATQQLQLQREENAQMTRLMQQQFEECNAKSNKSMELVDMLRKDFAAMTEQSNRYCTVLAQTLSDGFAFAPPRGEIDSPDI